MFHCMIFCPFNEGAKTILKGKNTLFDKWCWENRMFTSKRMKLDPSLTLYTELT